jgi:hypothetical protein
VGITCETEPRLRPAQGVIVCHSFGPWRLPAHLWILLRLGFCRLTGTCFPRLAPSTPGEADAAAALCSFFIRLPAPFQGE